MLITKASGKKAKDTEKESKPGKMEPYMKVTGKTEKLMVMED